MPSLLGGGGVIKLVEGEGEGVEGLPLLIRDSQSWTRS